MNEIMSECKDFIFDVYNYYGCNDDKEKLKANLYMVTKLNTVQPLIVNNMVCRDCFNSKPIYHNEKGSIFIPESESILSSEALAKEDDVKTEGDSYE